jgi:hypothetical protein
MTRLKGEKKHQTEGGGSEGKEFCSGKKESSKEK